MWALDTCVLVTRPGAASLPAVDTCPRSMDCSCSWHLSLPTPQPIHLIPPIIYVIPSAPICSISYRPSWMTSSQHAEAWPYTSLMLSSFALGKSTLSQGLISCADLETEVIPPGSPQVTPLIGGSNYRTLLWDGITPLVNPLC